MFKTKSGAVKLQVLITPAEYRELRRRAKTLGCSISALARTYLIDQLSYAFDEDGSNDMLAIHVQVAGKYQPRGFARRKRA